MSVSVYYKGLQLGVRSGTAGGPQINVCSQVFLLKGSYDAISSVSFSLECFKLFVHI